MSGLWSRIHERLQRLAFDVALGHLRRGAPLALDAASSLTVLSLLQHRDMRMYLAALQSFCRQVPVGQVVVVNDGSLTDDDQAVLLRRIPGVVLEPLERFRSPKTPAGGCWERLLAIAAHVGQRYVVQLDADTLTLGPLPEVAAAVAGSRAFLLGTDLGREFEPMTASAARAEAMASSHVQVLAERAFARLPDAAGRRYVRGCAGFCGFPAGSLSREAVEALSQEMEALVGAKWHSWGSEQVATNMLVSSLAGAVVLPNPAYGNPGEYRQDVTRFVHFIGFERFHNSFYRRTALRLVG